MRKIGLLQFGLLLLVTCSGCMTGPTLFERDDPRSRHEPGSDGWWAEKAALPPGVRQKYKKGKIWPVSPRSTQEPQQFSHTYHSAHYWPLPYVCQDRQYFHATMEQQVSLGWREETTLYDRHFESNSQQLNRAGQLHLDYLLHVIPPERRAVFIQSTYDSAMDVMRTEAVHAAIAQSSAADAGINVEVRDCQQLSRPAAEVERINTRYMSTFPAPRLGSVSSGSGGGGGGQQSGAASSAPSR